MCMCVCVEPTKKKMWFMLAVKFARRQFMCLMCCMDLKLSPTPKLMPLGRNFIEIILLFVYICVCVVYFFHIGTASCNQYVLRTRNLFLSSHIYSKASEKKAHKCWLRPNRFAQNTYID